MKYLRKFETQEEFSSAFSLLDVPNVSFIVSSNEVKYTPSINQRIPLYVEAIEDLTVSFSTNDIEYSLDDVTWQTLSAGANTPTIYAGNRCFFRAAGLVPTSSNGIGTFTFTGKCNIGGNVMSMIYGSAFIGKKSMPKDYNLRRMFYGNTTLINAKDMIVNCDNITVQGCNIMFKNCTNLVQGCILPAMNLSEKAYANMYEGCSNLEIGSDLPATEVTAAYCYNAMYANCSKLRYQKAMLLTTPSGSETAITGNWMLNVASEGVFVKNSEATWDVTGSHGIPSGWTVETANA